MINTNQQPLTFCDLETEALVLGALLRREKLFSENRDLLSQALFSRSEHAVVYSLIKRLLQAGGTIDARNWDSLLGEDRSLEGIGGQQYLFELYDKGLGSVTPKIFRNAVLKLERLRKKRQLLALKEYLETDLMDESVDPADIVDNLMDEIKEIRSPIGEESVINNREALFRYLTDIEQLYKGENRTYGLATGFRDVDSMLCGFVPGDLVVIASAPAMGKSSFALTMAIEQARHFKATCDQNNERQSVLYVAAQSKRRQLVEKITSNLARVSADRIRRADIDPEDFQSIFSTVEEIAGLPISVMDEHSLDIHHLRNRARLEKRTRQLAIVYVDYLHLVKGPRGQRFDTPTAELTYVTRELKDMAKELNIPVVVLAPINRGIEEREDKRPMLHDLRYSGSIEIDADIVAFLYRPEYYLRRSHPEPRTNEPHERFLERFQIHEQRLFEARNVAELIIAKNRMGPIGTVELFFDSHCGLFGDLDRFLSESGY